MMQYLDLILTAVQPVVTEILATAMAGVLAYALLAVRKYAGLKAEAIMRDALNQAISTGVNQAKPGSGLGSIPAQAVEYAKRSTPDAIKALGASDEVLFDKARAALNKVRKE